LAASYSALTSTLSLAAIAVLLLNDHFLKQEAPSWLTGKLSDFAGLLFAPYLLLLLTFALSRASSARCNRILVIAVYLAIGTTFAALKASASTAEPLLAIARLTGATLAIVTDPTDLIALSVLPFSFAIWMRPLRRSNGGSRLARVSRYATVCLAVFATVATSSPHPSIEDVVADARDPGTAYVVLRSTSADGVYMTSDAGASWRRMATITGALFADPTQAGTVFVLSGDSWDPALYRIAPDAPAGISVKPPSPAGKRPYVLPFVGADLFQAASWSTGIWYFSRNGDLFRTETAGATWTRLATPAPVDLLATANSTGMVYLATHAGELFRSDDAGDHWVRVGALPGRGVGLAVDPNQSKVLLAGVGKNLLRSHDGGSSWLSVYSDRGPGDANLARWIVRFDRASGRAYTIVGFGCCALLMSTDGGVSWSDAGTTASYVAVDVSGSVYAVGPSFTRIYRRDGGVGAWTDVTGELPVKP